MATEIKVLFPLPYSFSALYFERKNDKTHIMVRIRWDWVILNHETALVDDLIDDKVFFTVGTNKTQQIRREWRLFFISTRTRGKLTSCFCFYLLEKDQYGFIWILGSGQDHQRLCVWARAVVVSRLAFSKSPRRDWTFYFTGELLRRM